MLLHARSNTTLKSSPRKQSRFKIVAALKPKTLEKARPEIVKKDITHEHASLQKVSYYSAITKNILSTIIALGAGVVVCTAANKCVSKVHDIEHALSKQIELVHELKEHQMNDEYVMSLMYNAIVEFKQIGLA